MTAKSKAALEAEAKSESMRTFEYKGIEYTVNSDVDEWSVETMLAFEENRYVSIVKALLGPDQWNKYMATKPTNKDFGDFSEALFGVLGLSTGE